MASIKLGLIITDIAGSVGGSTFRRTPRGIILYNKQSSQIKSAFSPYSVKNKIGSIFAEWSRLDQDEKNQWTEAAALYPQQDRFGNTVYLTNRQFFTKLNTQLIPKGTSSDIDFISNKLPEAVLGAITNNYLAQELTLNFSKGVTVYGALVSVYMVRNAGTIKPKAHFRRTYIKSLDSETTINIFTEFDNQFPFAKIGDNFGINFNFINKSGFMSATQSFSFQLV